MDSWTLESFSSGASILRSSPAREGLHPCFPRCDCLGVGNTGDHALQIPTTSRVADLVDSGIKIVSTVRSVVEHVEIILIWNIMTYVETKFILLNRLTARCCGHCMSRWIAMQVTAVPLPREPGMLLDDIKQTQTGQDSAWAGRISEDFGWILNDFGIFFWQLRIPWILLYCYILLHSSKDLGAITRINEVWGTTFQIFPRLSRSMLKRWHRGLERTRDLSRTDRQRGFSLPEPPPSSIWSTAASESDIDLQRFKPSVRTRQIVAKNVTRIDIMCDEMWQFSTMDTLDVKPADQPRPMAHDGSCRFPTWTIFCFEWPVLTQLKSSRVISPDQPVGLTSCWRYILWVLKCDTNVNGNVNGTFCGTSFSHFFFGS